ncbi:hypothetical protein JCM10207_005406 [Rhodosporidiobolus poonsookiae]
MSRSPEPTTAPEPETRARSSEQLVEGDSPSHAAEPLSSPGPGDDADTGSQGGDDRSTAAAEAKESGDKADSWQAAFSAEAHAWYFWNSETGETTWTNPRDPVAVAGSSDEPASAADGGSTAPPESSTSGLPPIDPDLAWLDPAAATRSSGGGLAQAARFNARTGRFQGDPAMTPDRISDFQRGQRQQEAYYDVEGWEASLQGRGIKRGSPAEADDKKRPSSKQVEQFRRAKEDKKRKKLNAWLAS